jgi:hypothetical protein
VKWLTTCFFVLAIQPAFAQPTADWASARRELEKISLDSPQHCQRVWEVIWSWAKRGEIEARLDLWKAVSLGWVKPPGINQDNETMGRHAHTFLIHSMPSNDPGVLEEMRRTVTLYRSMTRSSAKPYLDCVAAADRGPSVGRLVDMGIVADFDAYARELDMLAAAPDARPADCSGGFHRR